MRAVVLTTVLPSGGRSGGELVTQGIVDALREGGASVSVVGYARPDDPAPADGEVLAGRRPIETASARARGALWTARALATRAPYSVAKYASRAYLATARRAVEGPEPAELVIADHAQVAFAVRRLGLRPVFVAHNVEADGYESLAAAARGPRARLHRREARRIGDEEAGLARAARQVWTLTEEDASAFRELAPDADVQPLAVPSTLDPPDRPAEPERDVALIGNWAWRPNALGLEWFVSEVLPLLSDDARVEVAGVGTEHLAGRDARLASRGVVPDAAEFMAGARVVAVPSVTGSGVQVKTLDAIASGVPVVTTETGVRGIGELPGSVAVASGPREFAGALAARAHADVRERLRAEAAEWTRLRRERFADQVRRLAECQHP